MRMMFTGLGLYDLQQSLMLIPKIKTRLMPIDISLLTDQRNIAQGGCRIPYMF